MGKIELRKKKKKTYAEWFNSIGVNMNGAVLIGFKFCCGIDSILFHYTLSEKKDIKCRYFDRVENRVVCLVEEDSLAKLRALAAQPGCTEFKVEYIL